MAEISMVEILRDCVRVDASSSGNILVLGLNRGPLRSIVRSFHRALSDHFGRSGMEFWGHALYLSGDPWHFLMPREMALRGDEKATFGVVVRPPAFSSNSFGQYGAKCVVCTLKNFLPFSNTFSLG